MEASTGLRERLMRRTNYLRSTRNMKVTCCDFIDAIRTAIVIFLVTSALATIYLSRQAYYEEVCRLTHGLNAYREFRLDIDRSIRPNSTQINLIWYEFARFFEINLT